MNKNQSNNITWHKSLVNRHDRNCLNHHKSVNIWFTGLSGSGKSTLAHALEKQLFDMGCRTFVFDGDNVRHGLCRDLGFSNQDRKENIRRITEMVNLFLEGGMIALTAFIAPFQKDRELIKNRLGDDNYIEIYCNCPVDVCEQRDVKGIYQKARNGLIKDFTGISSPYEVPRSPDLSIDTANQPIEICVEQIMTLLNQRKIFKI